MTTPYRLLLPVLVLTLTATSCGGGIRRSGSGGGGGGEGEGEGAAEGEGEGAAEGEGDGAAEGEGEGAAEGEGEGAAEGEGEGGSGIRPLQDEADPDHPAAGTAVQVVGVVSAGPGQGGSFHLADPGGGEYSGVYVYNAAGDTHVDVTGVQLGSRVTAAGEILEFTRTSDATGGSLTELRLQSATLVGAGSPPPAASVRPEVIAAPETAEPWEGVLVDVGAVTVTAPELEHGMFQVSGGLLVDTLYHTHRALPGQSLSHLRGVVTYDYGEFRVSPRSADDVGGQSAPEPTASPRDLQDPGRAGPAEGTTVRVPGVVVTAGPGAGGRDLFVQEPGGGAWSGLYVYNYNGQVDLTGVGRGTLVDLVGEFQEFKYPDQVHPGTTTELYLSGIELRGQGQEPEPVPIMAFDLQDDELAEPWEGVLVSIGNGDLVVTSAAPDGGWFEVDGVPVDDLFHAEPGVEVGQTFRRIVGVLHFWSGRFMVEPRSAADLTR